MAEIVHISKRKRTYGNEVVSSIKQTLDVAKLNPLPVACASVLLYADGNAVHSYSIGPNSFALVGALEVMKSDVMLTIAPEEDEAEE